MSEALALFMFIFLASLPGRTTFVMILLSANGHAWRIICGAGLAFLIQSLISVLAGEALALVPTAYVEIGAGLLFLFFAWKFWHESKQTETVDKSIAGSVRAVFTLIFMAELGDVSQLAIATTAARASSKVEIFAIAVAALWSITLLAVFVGRKMSRVMKPALLQKFASAAFLLVGLYLCFAGARDSRTRPIAMSVENRTVASELQIVSRITPPISKMP